MLLTAEELAALTGKQRPSAQRRVLAAIGIPYRVRPDGSIAVERHVVLGALGVTTERGPGDPSLAELWARYAREHGGNFYSVAGSNGRPFPAVSCVYLMIDGGKVHYVGQTVNLKSRLRYHRQRWWTDVAFIPLPEWWPYKFRRAWLDDMEHAVINIYTPSENLKRTYGDLPPHEILLMLGRLPKSWICNAS